MIIIHSSFINKIYPQYNTGFLLFSDNNNIIQISEKEIYQDNIIKNIISDYKYALLYKNNTNKKLSEIANIKLISKELTIIENIKQLDNNIIFLLSVKLANEYL